MTSSKPSAPKGLFATFEEDPEAADRAVFGRVSNADRRGFLRGAGLATMGAMLGAAIPFHRNMPAGFIPIALADSRIAGREGGPRPPQRSPDKRRNAPASVGFADHIQRAFFRAQQRCGSERHGRRRLGS